MKEKSKFRLGVWSCLLLICLAGCSGKSPSDGAMYEEVSQVLDGLVDHWNAGEHASLKEAYESAAEFLRGQDLVEWVELDTTGALPSLWAEFSNGIPFALMAAYNGHDLDESFRAPPVPRSISDFGLPGKKALFMQLVGLPSPAAKLSNWANKHGYSGSVKGDNAATVEFFRTLNSYDLLYISSHGAYLKRSNEDYFGIMTGELRTWARDAAFGLSGDFAQRKILLAQLVPVVGVGEYEIPELQKSATHYAVTDRYIDEHCGDFGAYSLVVLDMCESAKPHTPPYSGNPLIKVLLKKKAGGVFGWDESVAPIAAIRANQYLFSRMLGEDKSFEPRTPPLRPFGATAAFEGLESVGFHVDNINNLADPRYNPSGAKMVWAPREYGSQNDQQDVLLRPSIHELDGLRLVSDKELEIKGEFGTDPGEVCIADSCLSVKEWNDDSIIASCDPELFGPVTVRVDGRESNEVPLTQWEGVFEVNGDVDPEIGPHVEVMLHFRFRADIHKFRPTADADPLPIFNQDTGSFEEGVKCEYAIAGRVPAFEDERYEYNYTGSGNIAVSADGADYNGSATLRPAEGEMQVQVFCLAKGQVIRKDKQTGVPEDPEELYLPVMGYFTVPLDEFGAIEAGETDLAVGAGTVKVEWQNIDPGSPPDEDTPS